MMSRARRRVVPVAPARIDDNRGRLDRQGTDPWPSRPGRLSAQGRRVKIAIRRSPGKLAGVKHRVITWWRSGPAWSSARRWPSWRLGRPADHRLVAGAAGATDRHGNAREVREACTFPEDWRVREVMSGFTMSSYDVCWPVRTLNERDNVERSRRRIPAMAAVLTDHVWTMRGRVTMPGVQHRRDTTRAAMRRCRPGTATRSAGS